MSCNRARDWTGATELAKTCFWLRENHAECGRYGQPGLATALGNDSGTKELWRQFQFFVSTTSARRTVVWVGDLMGKDDNAGPDASGPAFKMRGRKQAQLLVCDGGQRCR